MPAGEERELRGLAAFDTFFREAGEEGTGNRKRRAENIV
jgi:hypothetical protein